MAQHEQHQHGHEQAINPIQIQTFLDGVNYPAGKQDLIDTARKQGAGEHVLETLRRMPDKRYGSPVDVSQSVGKER